MLAVEEEWVPVEDVGVSGEEAKGPVVDAGVPEEEARVHA